MELLPTTRCKFRNYQVPSINYQLYSMCKLNTDGWLHQGYLQNHYIKKNWFSCFVCMHYMFGVVGWWNPYVVKWFKIQAFGHGKVSEIGCSKLWDSKTTYGCHKSKHSSQSIFVNVILDKFNWFQFIFSFLTATSRPKVTMHGSSPRKAAQHLTCPASPAKARETPRRPIFGEEQISNVS